MNSPLLIAIAAGIVAGFLFASVATGSAIALALFYVAPLPILMAGFGWGVAAAGLATVAGAASAALAIGVVAGPLFAVGIGAPAVILSYFALLSRPATEGKGAGHEWYPVGRLLAVIALMGGVLAAVAVPFIGSDVESYRATVQDLFENRLIKEWESAGQVDAETLKGMSGFVARALPAAFATIWSVVMVFNVWAAGRILLASGRLARPWPNLHWIELPASLTAGFAAAVLLSFLPNLLGISATGLAGALFLPYILLGLAIVHVLTLGLPLRFAMLAALYIGIFLFGWLALVLGMIGLGEPAFRLRERFAGRFGKIPPTND